MRAEGEGTLGGVTPPLHLRWKWKAPSPREEKGLQGQLLTAGGVTPPLRRLFLVSGEGAADDLVAHGIVAALALFLAAPSSLLRGKIDALLSHGRP